VYDRKKKNVRVYYQNGSYFNESDYSVKDKHRYRIMEIEINFRFDENGRTGNTKRTEAKDDDEDDSSVDKKNVMDYDYKVQMTNIQESINDESSPTKKSWLDDILLDCEVSDYVLMPQTYWMPADGDTKARCALEQFALDIFHHHVPEDLDYDRETSGAEWWCQLRPSPHKTGRYSAAAQECSDEDDDGSKDPFVNGISFHVDKDEELRLLTGGSTYVHPHLSTVTYLTNIGRQVYSTFLSQCFLLARSRSHNSCLTVLSF
jgi:hypothetical protein